LKNNKGRSGLLRPRGRILVLQLVH